MSSVVIWLVAFGTYLLFAGTISADELVTGTVLASLATLWAYVVRQNTHRRFSAAREQIRPVLRAVAGVVPATMRTSAVLLEAVTRGSSPGRTMRCRFRFGFSEDPRARSRRALAVLCASLTPDRFVVIVERARSEALIHTIGSRREPDPEWLL